MHELQGRARQLPDGQHGLRVVQAQTFATIRIRPFTLGQYLVVDPAACFKLLLKDAALAVGKVDTETDRRL
jgi:hypothetical protein